VEPIASRDFPTKAARPGYSVLDSSRIEQAFGLVLPDWREALATVIGELAEQARPA
jgi:dTDP-4-dehydrorhamnose reductase